MEEVRRNSCSNVGCCQPFYAVSNVENKSYIATSLRSFAGEDEEGRREKGMEVMFLREIIRTLVEEDFEIVEERCKAVQWMIDMAKRIIQK